MRKFLLLGGALVLAGPLAFAQNPCPVGQSLYTLLGVSCVQQDRIFSNFNITSDPDTLIISGDQITVIFGGNPFSPTITFVYEDGPSLLIQRRNQRRSSESASGPDNVLAMVSLAMGQQYLYGQSVRSSGTSGGNGSPVLNSSGGSSSSSGKGTTHTAATNPGWFAPVPIQFDIPSLVPQPETGGNANQDLGVDSNPIGLAGDVTESPEPATMLLIGLGLSGLALLRRRKAR
jgi:hypothetical protein